MLTHENANMCQILSRQDEGIQKYGTDIKKHFCRLLLLWLHGIRFLLSTYCLIKIHRCMKYYDNKTRVQEKGTHKDLTESNV